MENCLVTTLKATVNNDSLKKLGVISFNAIHGENTSSKYSSRCMTLSTNGPITIKTYGSGNFSILNDESVKVTEYTFTEPQTDRQIYFKDDTYLIEINNKYNITKIATPGYSDTSSLFHFNIDDAAYCPISILNIDGNNVIGSFNSLSSSLTNVKIVNDSSNIVIDDLSKFINLVEFESAGSTNINFDTVANSVLLEKFSNFDNRLIYGNILSIAKLIHLNTLGIFYSNVIGAVEPAIVGLISNNRPNGSLNITRELKEGSITLNNKPFGTFTATFTDGACEITRQDVKVAEYSDGTWTYYGDWA